MAGLNKNKDLDLRRYGKNLYTKALKNSGNSGGEESEKSERFTLADLFMEIKKSEIELVEKSQGTTFPGEVLYPDTFVVDSGNGGYKELPRTAAFPFLTSMDNLVNVISAYTNHPTISDNTWASQKFMSNLRNISSGFHAVSIVTEDGTSEGGYPPRELYILVNNSDIG